MRVLGTLAVYLLVVFVGAAALAPWLWQAVQALAAGSHVAGQPFHRYVNRCLLGLALLGLWPLVRALGIRSWAEIGARWRQWRPREAGVGFLLGFVSLALAAGVVVLAGARQANPDLTVVKLLNRLGSAALTAALVAVLEEVLFRGAIYAALRRTLSFAGTAAVVSSIYALVHFFQRPAAPAVVGPLTGFTILGQMLTGFVDPALLVPGFFNLTLVGLLLAWARERTGALWLPIGMHAGWIFWLKAYGTVSVPVAGQDSILWGSGKLYDGWVTTAVLLPTFALLGWWLRRGAPVRPNGTCPS